MITGSRSRPLSVKIQETGIGRAGRSSVLIMMTASLNSRSLLDKTLGVRAGFERKSLLKLSTLRNPISATIKSAHLCPRIPRSGLMGKEENCLASFVEALRDGMSRYPL